MEPVRVVGTKWGYQPHWEFDAVRLGEDAHGIWLGLPVDTVIARPGARIETQQLQVVLTPRDQPFVATFYDDAPEPPFRTYVDIATIPTWSPGQVTSTDLDLDVIVSTTGEVWVDDEDEFDDHRVRWSYPEDIVALALGACAQVRADVTAGRPPFDGSTHRPWLDLLRH